MITADGLAVPWKWAPSGHVSLVAGELLALRSPIALVRIAASESLPVFALDRLFASRFGRLRVQAWRRAARRLRAYVRDGGDLSLPLGCGEGRIRRTLETISDVRARERVFASSPRNEDHFSDADARAWLRRWAEGDEG